MTYEDRNTSAVYALNSYVWKLLEANRGWSLADYKGKPIIPAQQQPEFMTTGKPFIVYGAARQSSNHLYALRTESIAYHVFSTSVTEANNVSSLLAAVFEEQDEAARYVNEHLGRENIDGGRAVQRSISFGSIRLVMVEKAEPAETEGGFVSSLVLLEAKYFADEPHIKQTSEFVYP